MEISESSGVDGILGAASLGASDRSSEALEFLCSGDIGGSSGFGDRASSKEMAFLTPSSLSCLLLLLVRGAIDVEMEARDAKAKADANSVGSTLVDVLSPLVTSAAITFRLLLLVAIIGSFPPSLIRLSTRLT